MNYFLNRKHFIECLRVLRGMYTHKLRKAFWHRNVLEARFWQQFMYLARIR